LQSGVDLETVSAILWQSQLSVTGDYYAPMTAQVMQPVLAQLSLLLQD
jgi:hypothetical protein